MCLQNKHLMSKCQNESFRYAKDVEIGDQLLVQEMTKLTPAIVNKISEVTMQG